MTSERGAHWVHETMGARAWRVPSPVHQGPVVVSVRQRRRKWMSRRLRRQRGQCRDWGGRGGFARRRRRWEVARRESGPRHRCSLQRRQRQGQGHLNVSMGVRSVLWETRGAAGRHRRSYGNSSQRGGGRRGGDGTVQVRVMRAAATGGGRVSLVNVTHQLLHLVQRVVEHEDVVPGQQERGDLAQLPHRGAVSVRHHLTQAVQRRVEVVHAPPLPAVDLQPQALQLLLVQALVGQARLLLQLVAQPARAVAARLVAERRGRGRGGRVRWRGGEAGVRRMRSVLKAVLTFGVQVVDRDELLRDVRVVVRHGHRVSLAVRHPQCWRSVDSVCMLLTERIQMPQNDNYSLLSQYLMCAYLLLFQTEWDLSKRYAEFVIHQKGHGIIKTNISKQNHVRWDQIRNVK